MFKEIWIFNLNMELNLIELKQVIDRIFHHVMSTRGVNKVTINENFYWDIPIDKLYDSSSIPEELDVGSLEDDWELLSVVLEDETIPLAYQLTELAPLIRKLGELLGKDLAEDGG